MGAKKVLLTVCLIFLQYFTYILQYFTIFYNILHIFYNILQKNAPSGLSLNPLGV